MLKILSSRSCLFVVLCLCLAGGAAEAELREGYEFERIESPGRVTVKSGEVEVREFFWYGCPHCFAVEPYIERWKPAENVVFVRTPAVLGKRWEAHAYAYYTLELLDKLEEAHQLMFEALHNRKLKLNTPESLAGFFEEELGIDPKLFLQTYHSFAVSTKINQAERLAKQYGLKGVPTFVIQGRYSTSPSMKDVGYKRLTQVIDALAVRETER